MFLGELSPFVTFQVGVTFIHNGEDGGAKTVSQTPTCDPIARAREGRYRLPRIQYRPSANRGGQARPWGRRSPNWDGAPRFETGEECGVPEALRSGRHLYSRSGRSAATGI